ncbi:hypothetical protein O181_020513 [Austropuccinia psidii MF-1]|uniref:Chromo domain-containing protein n=1 Tax=Austropuccinia psidii MF-1 TaxID=1389203 RepID=A0A9Q3CBK2_9BASI|nr:hypothetical protein [Austropuccinia psidii MF-1]
MAFLQHHKINQTNQKSIRKNVVPISNFEEIQNSFLPPQTPISMEFNPPSVPYSPPTTSQEIIFPNRNKETPPPIIIGEEEEWEVSQILNSKLKRENIWCILEWKALSKNSEGSTWESTENLKNFP